MTANNWPKVFFPLFLQSKVSEFLQLVSSTLQSYLATYSDSGMPDEESLEDHTPTAPELTCMYS